MVATSNLFFSNQLIVGSSSCHNIGCDKWQEKCCSTFISKSRYISTSSFPWKWRRL